MRALASGSSLAPWSSTSTPSLCATNSRAARAIGSRRSALVDRERILDRLGRLDPLLQLLDEVRAGDRDAYLTDQDTRLRTERALQLALQIVIDVGAHLVSELGLSPPRDYRGVFASLCDGGVIDKELARRLGDAAGLRNLLVHGYAELDDLQIWRALERLDDLRAFAASAARAAER